MTRFERQFQHEVSREPLWVGLLHFVVLLGLLAAFMWACTIGQ